MMQIVLFDSELLVTLVAAAKPIFPPIFRQEFLESGLRNFPPLCYTELFTIETQIGTRKVTRKQLVGNPFC